MTLRVLMLSWEYPPKVIGGLGRHVSALSQALTSQEVEVYVVASANEGAEWEEGDGLQVIRVREHFPPALSFPEYVAQTNSSLLQGALAATHAGMRFDVVHAHDWLTAYAARAVKRALDLPLISTIHATEWGRNGGLFDDQQRHISDVEWWLAFESWRVICCSRAMHDELQRIFQVPSDKIRVIPNGIDAPADIDTVESLPKRADERRRIFFIGRLVYEKGVDVLLQAFQRVQSAYPSAELVIAGRGPEERSLQQLAQHLGVSANVRFLGHISDEERNRFYRTAHAAVVPSRYEPFGIVALEAMAYGAPVIVARTGGLAEVVDDQSTGLHFAPGDVDALAGQLRRVLGDLDFGRSLARRAREAIRSRYDWRRIAATTAEVYQEVAEAAGILTDRSPLEITTSR